MLYNISQFTWPCVFWLMLTCCLWDMWEWVKTLKEKEKLLSLRSFMLLIICFWKVAHSWHQKAFFSRERVNSAELIEIILMLEQYQLLIIACILTLPVLIMTLWRLCSRQLVKCRNFIKWIFQTQHFEESIANARNMEIKMLIKKYFDY